MANGGVIAAGCGFIVIGVCVVGLFALGFGAYLVAPGEPVPIDEPQVTFPDGPIVDEPEADNPTETSPEDPGKDQRDPRVSSEDFELPSIPASKRGNGYNDSFYKSKRLLGDVHRKGRHETTFYCGCKYKKKSPELSKCGYKIKHDKVRASRIEYEHVVPASRFGRTFDAWKKGHADCKKRGKKDLRGRDCAEEVSRDYRLMQADMYNLQPAIGEVNGARSNYKMGIHPGEEREFGKCDVEIRDQMIEPAEKIRGDIARTYLYMDWAYPGRINLTSKERAMFLSWHASDPPDDWEIARARRILKIQKNVNPFIPSN